MFSLMSSSKKQLKRAQPEMLATEKSTRIVSPIVSLFYLTTLTLKQTDYFLFVTLNVL